MQFHEKNFFDNIWFHEFFFFCLEFLKFSGSLWLGRQYYLLTEEVCRYVPTYKLQDVIKNKKCPYFEISFHLTHTSCRIKEKACFTWSWNLISKCQFPEQTEINFLYQNDRRTCCVCHLKLFLINCLQIIIKVV